MIALRDQFEERTILQTLELRLLRRFARCRSDKVQGLGWNGESCVSLWHLIEEPRIDRAGFRHAMRAFVMHERLAKKFAHPAIDFPRPEVAVIEKNLELHTRLLIVIRQRHRNRRRRAFRYGLLRLGLSHLGFFGGLRGDRAERE